MIRRAKEAVNNGVNSIVDKAVVTPLLLTGSLASYGLGRIILAHEKFRGFWKGIGVWAADAPPPQIGGLSNETVGAYKVGKAINGHVDNELEEITDTMVDNPEEISESFQNTVEAAGEYFQQNPDILRNCVGGALILLASEGAYRGGIRPALEKIPIVRNFPWYAKRLIGGGLAGAGAYGIQKATGQDPGQFIELCRDFMYATATISGGAGAVVVAGKTGKVIAETTGKIAGALFGGRNRKKKKK